MEGKFISFYTPKWRNDCDGVNPQKLQINQVANLFRYAATYIVPHKIPGQKQQKATIWVEIIKSNNMRRISFQRILAYKIVTWRNLPSSGANVPDRFFLSNRLQQKIDCIEIRILSRCWYNYAALSTASSAIYNNWLTLLLCGCVRHGNFSTESQISLLNLYILVYWLSEWANIQFLNVQITIILIRDANDTSPVGCAWIASCPVESLEWIIELTANCFQSTYYVYQSKNLNQHINYFFKTKPNPFL